MNWYINAKVFTSTTAWKPKNLIFFSKKFEFWLLTKSWNHLSFVNTSPTLVIDTSMERSSRVLQHGNRKIRNWILTFFEVRNWIMTRLVPKSWNHSSRSPHNFLIMTTPGMHRRPFEGRHLVLSLSYYHRRNTNIITLLLSSS